MNEVMIGVVVNNIGCQFGFREYFNKDVVGDELALRSYFEMGVDLFHSKDLNMHTMGKRRVYWILMEIS